MKRTWSILLLYLFVLVLISGCLSMQDNRNETEATQYLGIKLTPISEQGNNAIKGTQYIDKDTYILKIDGMVERPANFTYDQITTYTPVSKVINLNCVEGWSFTAKWTGVTVKTLLDKTGIKENATNVIFYSADGYSTSHDLGYLVDNNIMLAYRINDMTLPPDRGFPLQLVAEGKYGYKWAKWIDHIELVNSSYKGYWESRGYNNKGDFGGPPYEQ
ncbi:MAG: molybdopterin-dependent oxidoreductase [Candidatus Methanoperedens sp.]|nr:molybdopterin-dependent oxidoreductase [Candidatus Methanoperedens sp.]